MQTINEHIKSYVGPCLLSFVFLLLLEIIPRPFGRKGPATFVGDKHWIIEDNGYPRLASNLRGKLIAGEFEHTICTDIIGRRISCQPDSTQANAEFELIALGDSVTMGWGVPYENTFPIQLANAIGSEGYHSMRISNLGCPATGLHSQFEHLQSYIKEHPSTGARLVIWTMLLTNGIAPGNDLNDSWNARKRTVNHVLSTKTHLTQEAERPEIPTSFFYQAKEWIQRNSILYELVMRAVGEQIRTQRNHIMPTTDHNTPLPQQWDAFGEILTEIRNFSQRTGIPIIMGYYPYLHDLEEQNGQAWNLLQQHFPAGMTLVDLRPELRKTYNQPVTYPRDGHPSSMGHHAIAQGYLSTTRALLEAQKKTPR